MVWPLEWIVRPADREVNQTRSKEYCRGGGDKSSDDSRPVRSSAKKAGPGRSSTSLFPENSRWVVQNGVLTSVKPKKARKAAAEEALMAERTDAASNDTPEVLDSAMTDAPGSGQLHIQSDPESAPTGQELLKAAGMNDEGAEDLPDFEDAAGDSEPPSAADATNEVCVPLSLLFAP